MSKPDPAILQTSRVTAVLKTSRISCRDQLPGDGVPYLFARPENNVDRSHAREDGRMRHVFRPASTSVTFLLNNAQVSWVIDGRWEIHLSVTAGTRRVYVSVVGFACRVSPVSPTPRPSCHIFSSDGPWTKRPTREMDSTFSTWIDGLCLVPMDRRKKKLSIVNHWCNATINTKLHMRHYSYISSI